MPPHNSAHAYGSVTKALHWGAVVLFVIQYGLVIYKHEWLPPNAELGRQLIVLWHKPLGVVVLFWALGFNAWKWASVKPAFIGHLATWERILARVVHEGLYGAMLLMPLSGVLMSNFAAKPISVFGWFDLPLLLAPNPGLAKLCYTAHQWLGKIIFALLGLHLAGVIKHQWLDKTPLLQRMLP